MCGRAQLDGRPLVFFATDPRRARGAIGVADGNALSIAIKQARELRIPMVWLLDCAGAKVDEGLPALAGFRRFFREALLANQEGIAILAVLGRGCYGGGSLLAMLANHRLYTAHTRLSTSGPGIIEAVEGKAVFDSADQNVVCALLGASARLEMDLLGAAVDEASARSTIGRWLIDRQVSRDWQSNHAALATRLNVDTNIVDCRRQLLALLPPVYLPDQRGNIAFSLPAPASGKAVFCGFLTGGEFGASDAWQLVDLLREVAQSHPRSPIILLLDASGHAARVRDERIILAEYLVHLCLCVSDLSARGHKTTLWIPGGASGAVYVAFAAPVERVSVLSSARVEILGSTAVDRILGRPVAGARAVHELVDIGIADAILDARLESYQAL